MAHLFVVEQTYTKPLSTIDSLAEAQFAWLDEAYARGTMLASGRQVPRKGTIYLATCQSKAELERVLGTSPFVNADAVEYRITEFVPIKTCGALADLRTDN